VTFETHVFETFTKIRNYDLRQKERESYPSLSYSYISLKNKTATNPRLKKSKQKNLVETKDAKIY